VPPRVARKEKIMYRLILVVFLIVTDVFSQSFNVTNLKDTENTCDFLIVCKSLFQSTAESHAFYRDTNALDEISNPKIALLEDIYSQFPDSASSSAKLMTFLQYCNESWTTSPRFVLFVGEPSPKDSAEKNYSCPTYYSLYNTTPDTSYIPFDDSLCMIDYLLIRFEAIGRMPVRTVAEYNTILTKIIAFESRIDYNTNSILSIYDDDLTGPDCFNLMSIMNFYGYSFEIESNKPSCYQSRVIQTIDYALDANNVKRFIEDSIVSSISKGTSLISYFGMGGGNKWSDEQILLADSIILKNFNSNSSIFLSFTSRANCFNVRDSCLGTKLLINENGGAVVSIGASGQAYFNSLFDLQSSFWANISQCKSIGTALYLSKTLNRQRANAFFNLLGDPALCIATDTISFSAPDTIIFFHKQTVDIQGSIGNNSNGVIKVLRYSLPQHIVDTTSCGTAVNHLSTPSIYDSTEIQLTNGRFTHSFTADFQSDTVLPIKIFYSTNLYGKRFTGSRYLLRDKSSSVKPFTTIGATNKFLSILPKSSRIEIKGLINLQNVSLFELNGKCIYSSNITMRNTAIIPINSNGVFIIKVNYNDISVSRKIQIIE
jgi:hypothetical protein